MSHDYVYMYQAALYCEPCGEALRSDIPDPPPYPEDEGSYDSDDYPKGPFANGEADCPHYCEGCGDFLENYLTNEGRKNVAETITRDVSKGRLDSEACKVWADFYDIPFPEKVGRAGYETHLVNPRDRDTWRYCYVLGFGAYGCTKLLIWANSLDDALDEAIDWLVENEPGHIVDDQVREEYDRLVQEHGPLLVTEEVAERLQEEAEADTTCGGNCGNYILSHEWFILAEDPTYERLKEIFDSR